MRWEIRVEGTVDQHWSEWFDGMQLTSDAAGGTVISGDVADHAALHGLLNRVHDVGLTLVSVTRAERDT